MAASDGSPASADGANPVAIRETIRRTRERIEAVTVADGDFGVACKDTGCSPAPVTDTTFETFEAAELACLSARAYRRALRHLDPSLPEYDLVVCVAKEAAVEQVSVRKQTCGRRENGLPETSQSVTVSGGGTDEWLRVDNAPVVHLRGGDSLLDDEFVTRQLESKLVEER
jgi:hypothetical protein